MPTFRTFSKIFFGLTLVAVSTNGYALSLASVLHLHPHLGTNARGRLTLSNPNYEFRDVLVDNKFYTVLPRHRLIINAPAGTPVFAASGMFRNHRKGAVLTQVDSKSATLALD